MATFVICHTANTLKHIALWEIHCQLINTCLIISSVGWRYCNCYEFSDCRQRPSHRNLSGERNYCLSCQIRKTYNFFRCFSSLLMISTSIRSFSLIFSVFGHLYSRNLTGINLKLATFLHSISYSFDSFDSSFLCSKYWDLCFCRFGV